jgi:hypothetical protein
MLRRKRRISESIMDETRAAIAKRLQRRADIARDLVPLFWLIVLAGFVARASGLLAGLEVIGAFALFALAFVLFALACLAMLWCCVKAHRLLVDHFYRKAMKLPEAYPGANKTARQRADAKAQNVWAGSAIAIVAALILWAFGPLTVIGYVAVALIMGGFAVSAILGALWPFFAPFLFIIGGTLVIVAVAEAGKRE